MHPSLMIRHSEAARKTDRVRRYMTAQMSWVQAGTATTERKDEDDRIYFLFFGGYEENKSLRREIVVRPQVSGRPSSSFGARTEPSYNTDKRRE
jgi:hypothetical protein